MYTILCEYVYELIILLCYRSIIEEHLKLQRFTKQYCKVGWNCGCALVFLRILIWNLD